MTSYIKNKEINVSQFGRKVLNFFNKIANEDIVT